MQAVVAIGVETGNPPMRTLAGDSHGFGDMRDGHAEIADTMHEQTSTMHGETGVTVRHEDLLDCEAANSTMPGGLQSFRDPSPTCRPGTARRAGGRRRRCDRTRRP